MSKLDPEVEALLSFPEFPRAAKYDPVWVLENQMGPNVLWLTEGLAQVMNLKPGMRVLDMGCGRAVSSIFLAKEFGVQVWAADLWISVNDNWARICNAGVGDQVFPFQTEAHSLPFANEFFDAIVSMDAYHYFGTDDLYLGSYFARLLKPGGQIGVCVPGLAVEPDDPPEHLRPFWEPEYYTFHSPAWWRRHWQRSGKIDVTHADLLPDGWKHWLNWMEARLLTGFPYEEKEAEMLRVDAGRTLGFARIVGRRE